MNIGDPFVPVGHVPAPVSATGHIISDHRRAAPRIVTMGLKVVLGVRELKPIFGAPDGRQRLRMRNDRLATLFIKTATGIRSFKLEDCGDRWFCNPRLEQGRNERF